MVGDSPDMVGAAVRGQLDRFCALSSNIFASNIFDSGSAPLYPRVHEEEETGTRTRRPYRSMLVPMYAIVPRSHDDDEHIYYY